MWNVQDVSIFMYIYYKIYLFSEFLGKMLRQKYQHLTVPVQCSVGIDSEKPAYLEDIFVEMHLQKQTTESFPEKFSYFDMKEMETRVQSNDAIPIANLFSNQANDAQHKTKAPTKVLIQGKPGVGKSTLAKHIASQWAKGILWSHIKYVFLVPLKKLPPNEKWSISNLLLDGLITPDRHKACLDVITEHPDESLVILEGFDEGRMEEAALSTLISQIINNEELTGANILVTSRPTKQLGMKAFNHTVQLYGFTSERIRDYVRKITDTKKEEEFIMNCLNANPNMAGLCHVPLHCVFVCQCLAGMYASAERGETPTVNTTTDLFVQVTLQTASKLHACFKYSKKKNDFDDLFNIIEAPLRRHAGLARYGIMSVPPKFFFHEEDLDKFHFDETDRNCGFLVASTRPHPRMKTGTCSGWEFSHATLHEFFSAVGMLRSDDSVWEKLEDDTLVEQLKTMLMFVGGLVGDPKHEYYVERLVLGDQQLNPQQSVARLRERMLKKITDLMEKVNDNSMKIVTAFESQNPQMVHVVPTEIESSSMSIMDIRALVWLLNNENYHIKSLR